MIEFSVYEKRYPGRSYIGSVVAKTYDDAVDAAHDEYGAPIEVEEPAWVDKHSVTCLLCGGLADETGTVDVSEDRLDGAFIHDHPDEAMAIERLVDDHGTGEAHTECFEYVVSNGPYSEEKLEARNHR